VGEFDKTETTMFRAGFPLLRRFHGVSLKHSPTGESECQKCECRHWCI